MREAGTLVIFTGTYWCRSSMRSITRKRTARFWSGRSWKESRSYVSAATTEKQWHHVQGGEREREKRDIDITEGYCWLIPSVCSTFLHMLRMVSVCPVGLTKWHQTHKQAVWCVFICVRELPSTLHLYSAPPTPGGVHHLQCRHGDSLMLQDNPTPVSQPPSEMHWLGCSSHHVAACKCVCNECVNTVKPAGADISVCARGFVHTWAAWTKPWAPHFPIINSH